MPGSNGAATAPPAAQSTERKDRSSRRGSSVSDRQIARSALHGRKVTFRFLACQPSHEVTGYVTAMDDYHWMVSSVVPEDQRGDHELPIINSLVHKSRVDMIKLWPDSTISQEEPVVQAALNDVGGSFWRYCEQNYAGR